MTSAETQAYREKTIAHYDDAIASVQGNINNNQDDAGSLVLLGHLKELRVWAETCEPPKFRPVDEVLDETRRILAADPNNQEAKNTLALLERIKAK